MNRTTFQLHILAVLLLLSLASGCATRQRTRLTPEQLVTRATSTCEDTICVSVASLAPDEMKTHFGYPLFDDGVTPIWVHIENPTDDYLWVMPIYADPDYYDSSEIAIKYRGWFSRSDENRCLAILENESLTDVVVPQSVTAGFIFTEKTVGSRIFSIVLLGQSGVYEHIFHLPGYKNFDHNRAAYPVATHEDFDAKDFDQLRALLAEIPSRTSNAKQTRTGDPINFFLVGDRPTVFKTLAMGYWDETEALSFGTAWKTFLAFFSGSRYMHSPVSPLYLFGRCQDAAFQKVRDTIHARNHLRLWLTPYTYQGTAIWAGQISRDVGIRFTTTTPNLTTHIVDPDVDAARWYLIQDIISCQHIKKVEFVRAGQPISRNKPAKNLTGDPFYSDGLQAVLFLSDSFVPLDELEIGDWKNSVRRKHL